jgi:hypothetical protein
MSQQRLLVLLHEGELHPPTALLALQSCESTSTLPLVHGRYLWEEAYTMFGSDKLKDKNSSALKQNLFLVVIHRNV